MFSKKSSFDESPVQDLSTDQLSQVAGGCDAYSKKDWNWQHKYHHHHHKTTSTMPVEIEIIVKEGGKTKTYWEKGW